jgi:hypothetical protein
VYHVISLQLGAGSMSIKRSLITGNPALRWLLVMAMLVAPLQGAMSALGSNCHADHVMTTAEVVGNGSQATVDADVTPKKCCCEDACNQEVCDGGCDAAHSGFSLVSFAPVAVIDPHLPIQAQPLDQLVSHLVSPLLRPPQI